MNTSFPAALLLIWVVLGVPSILLARMAAKRMTKQTDKLSERTVSIFQTSVRYLILFAGLLFIMIFVLFLIMR